MTKDNMKYILIQWPDSQYLMTIEGFREHSSLADADYAGSSAYFVEEDWLKEVMENGIMSVQQFHLENT